MPRGHRMVVHPLLALARRSKSYSLPAGEGSRKETVRGHCSRAHRRTEGLAVPAAVRRSLEDLVGMGRPAIFALIVNDHCLPSILFPRGLLIALFAQKWRNDSIGKR